MFGSVIHNLERGKCKKLGPHIGEVMQGKKMSIAMGTRFQRNGYPFRNGRPNLKRVPVLFFTIFRNGYLL